MKKEIALATISALLAANIDLQDKQVDATEINEVTMDHYVTGCQCKSPKPHFKIAFDNQSYT